MRYFTVILQLKTNISLSMQTRDPVILPASKPISSHQNPNGSHGQMVMMPRPNRLATRRLQGNPMQHPIPINHWKTAIPGLKKTALSFSASAS
ncbi:MAG TPA: hypothetical protein VIS57_12730 [Xanthomonadales bacterium]